MAMTANYKLNLYIDGTLIGNVRKLAQGLTWVRRRTKAGADSIDFTLNDVVFARWLAERNTNIGDVLRPLALECRVVRNGVEVVGGFLATMPAYSPNGTSADLAMRFDGYLNLLAGVYIRPIGTVTGRMGALVRRFITEADTRALNAGKAFGFTPGEIGTMASIVHTFDNYKPTKEWICDRCDNITGAGQFDVYFHANKTYDVIPDAAFGDIIQDWTAHYPTRLNSPSASSISAPEVGGFASSVLGIGAGEVSPDPEVNTVITSSSTSTQAVMRYGYAESLLQESSISVQATLDNNVASSLSQLSNPTWEPRITLSGRHVAPTPAGDKKIWVGDTITVDNSEDLTGQTNGQFRVDELEVKVGATGAEDIIPTLERTTR